MKILFVINPKAGSDSNNDVITRIQETAALKSADFKILYTQGKEDDYAMREELKQYQPDRVVASGGDGTIQLVARNLMGSKFSMVILPLGSANGLATSLGMTNKKTESIDYVFEELREISFDLLLINDTHICAHLADIGINATMVKEYKEAGGSGMIGYARHLVYAIQETPLLNYTIKTEKETKKLEGYMLAFANAPMYGTGIRISNGLVDDGLFEIRNIEKVEWGEALKAGLTIFNIFTDEDMFLEVISCKHAEVFIDRKVDFQIDGEYMGQIDHLKIDILPSAITLLIP